MAHTARNIHAVYVQLFLIEGTICAHNLSVFPSANNHMKCLNFLSGAIFHDWFSHSTLRGKLITPDIATWTIAKLIMGVIVLICMAQASLHCRMKCMERTCGANMKLLVNVDRWCYTLCIYLLIIQMYWPFMMLRSEDSGITRWITCLLLL